jgi:hypothetical protein
VTGRLLSAPRRAAARHGIHAPGESVLVVYRQGPARCWLPAVFERWEPADLVVTAANGARRRIPATDVERLETRS